MKHWVGIVTVALASAFVAFCAATPESRPHGGAELFGDAPLHPFKIEIPEPELEKLRRANLSYVHATVTVGGQVFKDVAVRLKGRGSFRPLNDRPSFAVKFDEFVAGQKFHGLTKVMLNNSSQDPTLLSEFLATGLFRDAGVPAARVTHARVEFNGRDLGFYVLVEAMNKPFLKQHFRNPNGALYEGYAQDIDQQLDQDGGPPGDQSEVRALVEAARAPASERLGRLRRALDVDRFVSFLAVSLLIAQHDSYPLNRNNYRLYRDPDSGRFVMIAHGIDGSFSQNSMSIRPPSKYILARALMELPEGRQLYHERLASLFTNVFKLDVMTNRIHAASVRLQAAAVSDSERTNLATHATSFIRRIIQRHRRVAAQLGDPEPLPLVFGPDQTANLKVWDPQVDAGTATLDERSADGANTLYIKTGSGICQASWRKRVLLEPGRYRFAARVRMANVAPGPRSTLTGVAVRLSGTSPTKHLLTNGTWTDLAHTFAVRDGAEEVVVVCELRAAEGEAWFDAGSLKLVKE